MVAMPAKALTGGESPRLLLLSSEFPPGPGGIGHHAYQLAGHLSRLGWDVTVLSPQEYVSAAERDAFNRRQPFAVTPLPGREAGRGWWAGRLRAVAGAIRGRRPHVLLGTGRRALWLAAAVHSLTGIPWAAVGHGSEFTGGGRGAALTRRALHSAKAVIAVSDYTAGLIRAAANPRRLVVIPNAADGARFRPSVDTTALRRRWDLGEGPVLLTVGQVSERKAQDTVIRALPAILAHHPRATYVMAGLPREEAAFGELAAELGVAERVRFTGLVADEELAAVYNLADVFVLMSRRTAGGDVEGYGIVVQEAALCGVPAVVSQDCGLEEAIRDGETGLSAPPDDPAATAAAILSLLDDPDRRRAMGRRAREVALTATWAERVAAYDRELRALLPAPAAAGEVS
jgi:phosphatidylinositol alpha-1,6-mannosyltransferase